MTRFAARARTAFIARCTATITAVTTILAASLTGLPLAAASPAVPLDPNSSDVAPQWVNPAIRPGEGERAQLSLLDAPSATDGSEFEIKLRLTNLSPDTLSDLAVTVQRGPATGSVSDQRVAAVAAIDEYATTGATRELETQIEPGNALELHLFVTPDELPLPAPDVYPMLIRLADADGTTLDTERFHLAARPSGPTPLPDQTRAAGLTALYPISAAIDIVPGETGEAPENPELVLASDQLASQLAPEGRLTRLVDTYLEATANQEVAGAMCAALDPALIETVDRMVDGYRVSMARKPAVEEPKRLRDSWGQSHDSPPGGPGDGADDAALWMEKVRRIAQNGCTVALPWANTDINAVARVGDPWLVREAIERGPFALSNVLGATGTMNTVVPSSGYVNEEAVAALGWADHSRSTIPTEGLSGPWERAVAQQESDRQADGADTTHGRSALEDHQMGAPAWAAAPPPESPVRVLVPAGTVGADTSDAAQRFSWLGPGIMAVTYNDALAATLATVGLSPETAGYSNETLRYDYAIDSPRARAINAAAAIQLAVQSAWTNPDEPEVPPVFVNPPASWDADAAATLLGTVADLITSDAAHPVPLNAYLAPDAGAGIAQAAHIGTAFADPTVYSDSEILSATQQTGFINDLSAMLVPDPSIALTRYGFTLPLRRDILNALSPTGRRTRAGYREAVTATSYRLSGSRATLGDLREAVSLIPPGNVYTRTSASSPLLIVAQNGMPLPVDAAIRYTAADGSRLNVPDHLRIPARGSVTVQMTADLPADARSANLQLYLAGPRDNAISRPVDISVRTPQMALRSGALLAGGGVILALLLLYRIGKRRKRGDPATNGAPPDAADT